MVYADDTLLIDVDPDRLHAFMTCIGQAGLEYGLSFNWTKLELLPVRMETVILKPDGSPIAAKSRMLYLGAMLSDDTRVSSELNRRLGMARADVEKLRLVWSHAGMNSRRKLRIFDACVVTKLMYGLKRAW